jgi:hypothetical protein
MADIIYWGLTGTKRSVTGITLATATVDTLITAIATDEGLPADYYHWSLLSDPSKNSITYGDSSTKLSAIGVTDGATVLCTPQQNESKQERQLRKLYIAQAKKQAFGDTTKPYYRVNNTFDITLLPDTYATAADDNPNTGGLLQGRPWINIASITFTSGVYHRTVTGTTNANGYFGVDFIPANDDLTFFDTYAATSQGVYTSLNLSSLPEYTSIMLTGYFLAPTTDTYTFYTSTDDASYMWIGPDAITGYTHTNAIVQNGGLHGVTETSGTIAMTANIYYPFRVMFGNLTGPGTMTVSWASSTQAKTSTWTGKLFYNTATNGF